MTPPRELDRDRRDGQGFQRPTAALLPGGTVLVAGGDVDGPVASAELYDPRSRTWTTIATMTEPRWYHTATLLQDGTVLVTGSGAPTQDGPDSAAAELYDPGKTDGRRPQA